MEKLWSYFFGLLLFISQVSFLQESTPEMIPVPKAQLKKKMLKDVQNNFSIEAPTDQFEWFFTQTPSTKTFAKEYICLNQEQEFGYMVLIFSKTKAKITQKEITQLIRAIKKESKETNSKLSDIQFKPSPLPIASSFTLTYKVINSEDVATYFFSYITPIGILQMLGDNAKEPSEFKKFASSFKLLRPLEVKELQNSEEDIKLFKAYIILIFIVFIVVSFINKSFGKTVLNYGKVSAILILISCFLHTFFIFFFTTTKKLQVDKSAELMANVFSNAIIPLVITLYLWSRVKRVKERKICFAKKEENEIEDKVSQYLSTLKEDANKESSIEPNSS